MTRINIPTQILTHSQFIRIMQENNRRTTKALQNSKSHYSLRATSKRDSKYITTRELLRE